MSLMDDLWMMEQKKEQEDNAYTLIREGRCSEDIANQYVVQRLGGYVVSTSFNNDGMQEDSEISKINKRLNRIEKLLKINTKKEKKK